MSNRVAFITGVTGQDGSYLAELLLEKDYVVHGLVRHTSLETKRRISHIYGDPRAKSKRFSVHYGDMTDSSNLTRLLTEIQPDEIYNLAAQSHVKVSFEVPEYTGNVDALGALRLLEAARIAGLAQKAKVYQASTSELYGIVQETPQSETTPFYPRSPYAAAKLYAYWMTINYREGYDFFASNGILFNHESPRRGNSFVTKKIACAVADIVHGKRTTLYLGNLHAKRDWGYAPDFVDAMWRILQHDHPDDFVIATGETHSVREFVEAAFACVDMSLAWEGSGQEEKALDAKTGAVLVAVDPWYFRPTEVDLLIGDASKARSELNWQPSVGFNELVEMMVAAELVG